MWMRRLRYWLQSSKREADLREEMELHIQEKVAEMRERGLREPEALAEARRRFGNLSLKQEDAREIWIARYWSEFWTDLRYGARSLAAQPGFTTAALLALILGIGVNAVLFNIYNSLAFAPWAIRDANETVQVWMQRGDNWNGVSWPHFRYLRENMQSFDGLTAFTGDGFRIENGDAPWNAEVVLASENYFDVIGTGFSLGRGFSTAAGDRRNPAPEVVLQHETWKARFNSDPDIAGTWIQVGGHPFQVVGVAAPGFHGASATQTHLWLPGSWNDILRPDEDAIDNPGACCVSLIGRLRPAATRSRAQAEIDALSARFFDANGQSGRRVLLTTPSFMSNPARFTFFSLVFFPIAAAFFLILLLACANVANLQLARSTARRQEIATRLALGAGRGRILRQFWVENLLLSALAGIASVAVSTWIPAWIFHAVAGPGENLVFRFDNDVRVLGSILLMTLVASLLFGFVPALNAIREAAAAGMRDGMARTTPRSRLRPALLAAQVALCTILLSGTVSLIRSLDHVRQMDTGIQAEDVIVVSTGLDTSTARDEEARDLLANAARRLAAIPGVESVAWADTVPLGEDFTDVSIASPGTQEERIEAGIARVSASFFETLQIPLVAGRAPTPAEEAADSLEAAVVNEALADLLWPGENAVDKTLESGRRVVGVVRNFSMEGAGSEGRPYIWIASPGGLDAKIFVRHAAGSHAGSLLNDLSQQLNSLDQKFLASAEPYSETIYRAQRSSRISAATGVLLGGLCLLLACIGIYGVAGYNVARRTREFGIRMALGAHPRGILTTVLRQNLKAVGIGAVVGIAGAVAFGRLLARLLYGVSPADPLTILATIVILFGTSILAACGPARRAARVDPAITLRHE